MTTPTDQEARVQNLRQLIEAYASARYRTGVMNYTGTSELQDEANEAVQAAYGPLDAALRSLAASATQGEAVRWEYQLRNPGFATAVGMSWTECSKQRYEELKGMDRYEVRALAAIKEPAPAPQAATQGEAVAWQRRSYLQGLGWSEWLPCSREAYFEIHYGKSAHVQARALAAIKEPAPAPSKEQKP